MTWRIHSFSPASGQGTVVSPHFGPWGFGPAENPFDTRDFEVGGRVLVELDGPKHAYVVRAVIAERQRQPEGTACEAFAELNRARPPDVRVEESSEATLRLWLGDCCEACGDWWTVRFTNPRGAELDEDTDLDSPLLRYASDGEVAESGLSVLDGRRAYCIVTGHGSGRDGPRVFFTAERVEVEHHAHDPAAWSR